MVRGNNKPHVKSDMRKAIMTRTRLKTRANKSGNDEDRKKYKQQRNLIVSMNRKCFSFRGAQLWNSLSAESKQATTVSLFKQTI